MNEFHKGLELKGFIESELYDEFVKLTNWWSKDHDSGGSEIKNGTIE